MTGHPVDLTGAHLLDLRRGPSALPLADIPTAVVPDAHQESPTGWHLHLALYAEENLLTIITAPDGQQIILADTVGWNPKTARDLASVHHLSGIFRKPDNAPIVPFRYGWFADEAWARAERLHAIARALPRLTPTRVSSTWASMARRHARDALSWSFLSADEAVAWQAAGVTDATQAWRYAWHGHTPSWSRGWIDLDCEQKWAAKASDAGWIPQQVAALDAVCDAQDPHVSLMRHRREWLATELPPQTAVLACSAGLTPDEAREQADTLDDGTLSALAVLRDLPAGVLAAANHGSAGG